MLPSEEYTGASMLAITAAQETDATLPPWRDVAAMLSKWQPRRSIDMDWDAVPSAAKAVNPAKAAASQGAAPKHVRRHSGGGRASPRGAADSGATGAAVGLGIRSASQVGHTASVDTNPYIVVQPVKQRQTQRKAKLPRTLHKLQL